MESKIPLACHLGLWHRWSHWVEFGEVIKSVTHLPSNTKLDVGKIIVQRRQCQRCGALDHRRSRV